MRRRKYFYAVAESTLLPGPVRFSDWEKAQAWVTGCSSKFKGFLTLEEAQSYLEHFGFHEYRMDVESDLSDQWLGSTSPHYYSVSRGREVGLFTSYGDGAQPQVQKYSGACHKAYSTPEACKKAVRKSRKAWESRTEQESIRKEISELVNVLHH